MESGSLRSAFFATSLVFGLLFSSHPAAQAQVFSFGSSDGVDIQMTPGNLQIRAPRRSVRIQQALVPQLRAMQSHTIQAKPVRAVSQHSLKAHKPAKVKVQTVTAPEVQNFSSLPMTAIAANVEGFQPAVAGLTGLVTVSENNSEVSYGCSNNSVVITANHAVVRLQGNCQNVTVLGNHNKVLAWSLQSVQLVGNHNQVSWLSNPAPMISNVGNYNVAQMQRYQ